MHIKTIGVIGANPAGREIALAALIGGYRVVLEDVSREMLEKGTAYIKQSLDERAAHRELSQQERESALARLSGASRVDEVCRVADMLIETVPDEMEVKLEIFTIFDKFAKPGAILASQHVAFDHRDCLDYFSHRGLHRNALRKSCAKNHTGGTRSRSETHRMRPSRHAVKSPGGWAWKSPLSTNRLNRPRPTKLQLFARRAISNELRFSYRNLAR